MMMGSTAYDDSLAKCQQRDMALAMELDIAIEGWPEGPWHNLAGRCAQACAETVSALANPRLEASLLFTGDDTIHALNREWRERDKPTNVLSFPMLSGEELAALEQAGPPVLLGDIALSHETCQREAAAKGITLADHSAHLLIHGFLHLAGYDHVDSTEEAAAMEALEIKALAKLGIADPYGDIVKDPQAD